MPAENWVQVGFTDESMSAGVVVWNGAAEILVHSPALYLDELLLRDRERDAREFLTVVEGFFRVQQEHDMAGLPRLEATVLDLPESDQYRYPFIVRTELQEVFQAKSTFTPRLKAPRMLYPAFWMYWNKLIQERLGEAPAVRDNILVQCEWYRANGFSYRNLGQAPAHAAASGASQRLADEIGSGEGAGSTGVDSRTPLAGEGDHLPKQADMDLAYAIYLRGMGRGGLTHEHRRRLAQFDEERRQRIASRRPPLRDPQGRFVIYDEVENRWNCDGCATPLGGAGRWGGLRIEFFSTTD